MKKKKAKVKESFGDKVESLFLHLITLATIGGILYILINDIWI